MDVPKGDPRDPMTEDEIGVKFTALGKDVMGEARCKELRQLIMKLDQEKRVERLMDLMTSRAAAGRHAIPET